VTPAKVELLRAFVTVLATVEEGNRAYTAIMALHAVGDTHCIRCASCDEAGREALMSVTGVVKHMRDHQAERHDLVVDEARALAGDTVIGLPARGPQ
jgi:hypothetical protein